MIHSVFEINQGTKFEKTFTVTRNGTPVDLTGYTIEGKFRRSYYWSVGVFMFSTSIVDPENGVVKLEVNSEYSSSIIPGRYVYDVQVTLEGESERIIEGVLEVKPSAILGVSFENTFSLSYPQIENVLGVKDGINTIFVIDSAFNAVFLFLNGLMLTEDIDYTLTSNTVEIIGDQIPNEDSVFVALIFN